MMSSHLDVTLYFIHHDIHARHHRLASNRDMDESGLYNVREFLSTQKNVIRHTEIFPDLYLLPSCKISLELCVSGYDLHLWLEDDAIVCDRACYLWPELMRGKEVGIFRDTSQNKMFNCAFMLTTPEYDSRLLDVVKNYKDDGAVYPDSSQFERLLWDVSRSYVMLDRDAAMRHHPVGKYRSTVTEVAEWLRGKGVPDEELFLLNKDFTC